MTLQQIRCVVEVVRQRLNISAAARNLYLSQPGVSRHIRLFEEELGVRLFVRNGTSLSHVTDEGKLIIQEVEAVLRSAERLRELGREIVEPDGGALSVGTTHTQARYVLPPVIERYMAAFPRVRLHLHQGSPREVAAMAADGAVDFVIATEAVLERSELVALPLYAWTRYVVVPCGHPLTELPQLDLESIARYPLITYTDGFTGRASLDEAFAARGLEPNVVITASDADVIKTYVRRGLGVGVIAAMAYVATDDADLCTFDAAHLFPRCVARLGVRRDRFLRRSGFGFVATIGPHLRRELVEQALALRDQAEVDALFPEIPEFRPLGPSPSG